MMTGKYESVIGLEVHAQLLTKSKLFCSDSAEFGGYPNTRISPVSLAHPGTLPRLNKSVVGFAVKLGLALHCNIQRYSYFARKNYFYPDLPKGYQLSQDTKPICRNGFLAINAHGIDKQIDLDHIHIEEDAGKSIHDPVENYSSIDLNRAGVPLLEIVTKPVISSADEAFAFLTELRKLVRYLGICDGNMEEGSMRCDANISVRLKGDHKLGTRVEVKNLNSMRNVKKAIESEVQRLVALLDSGNVILQETRSFDADNGTTFSLRTKEEVNDYRYFPDPDLPPFSVTDEMIEEVRRSMPELPSEVEEKFKSQYSLSAYDARLLSEEKDVSDLFEMILQYTGSYKTTANIILGPVKAWTNENNLEITDLPVSPENLASLVQLIDEGKISFTVASSRLFPLLIQHPLQSPFQLATESDLLQESSNDAVALWVDAVIERLPEKVAEYKKGKRSLLGLFAGEVKKLSKGKADMQLVNELLKEKLK